MILSCCGNAPSQEGPPRTSYMVFVQALRRRNFQNLESPKFGTNVSGESVPPPFVSKLKKNASDKPPKQWNVSKFRKLSAASKPTLKMDAAAALTGATDRS